MTGGGSPRVERFTGSGEEWDAFTRAQTACTHFHLYGWNTVIARVFGHECPYLVARDETGALCGVLPLVRVKSLLFGHYLVSMPFLNYGGPLGDELAVQALAAAAGELAERDGRGFDGELHLSVGRRAVAVVEADERVNRVAGVHTSWSAEREQLRSPAADNQKEVAHVGGRW